jgi:hypothetical protein
MSWTRLLFLKAFTISGLLIATSALSSPLTPGAISGAVRAMSSDVLMVRTLVCAEWGFKKECTWTAAQKKCQFFRGCKRWVQR